MARGKDRKPVPKKPGAKKRTAVKRSDTTQVVAEPKSSDRPKKGPDGLTNEQRLKRLGESKENLRESSYHEAGHAVWAFLDGRLDSIKRIRIAYKDGAVGEYQFSYGSYALKHELAIRRSQHQLAAAYISLNFSGPVCQYIYTKESDAWNCMLDEWYGSEHEAGQSTQEWKCDFQHAIEIGFKHFGIRDRQLDSPGEEVMALLEQVWDWTIELFRLPQVWKVVNALARELIAQAPGTMSGRKAQRIIRAAWKGPPKQVPMAYLGEPHVSRFGIEAGVQRPF